MQQLLPTLPSTSLEFFTKDYSIVRVVKVSIYEGIYLLSITHDYNNWKKKNLFLPLLTIS